MMTNTGTEAGRISDRAEIEASLRPPRPTFEDAFRSQNRSELEIAAHGLSPTAISNVLAAARLDPSRGLQGVPESRQYHVRQLLTAAYRSAA